MALIGAAATSQWIVASDLSSDFRTVQQLQCNKCTFLQGTVDLSLKATFKADSFRLREFCRCNNFRAGAYPGRQGNPHERHRSPNRGRRPVRHVEEKEYNSNDADFGWESHEVQSSGDFHWKEVGDELIIGKSPSELYHVDLISAAGAKALIALQRPEEDSPQFSWDDVSFKAMSLEIVTARVSMDDKQIHDQALSLPESVKIVASLTATGRKVYLCDHGNSSRGALVALGFLTFVKGMELKDALNLVLDAVPEASPSIAAWEEAKNRILAGHATRVARCAKGFATNRLERSIPGTSADDWIRAQKQVISEIFQEGVETQVSIADAMTQIAVLRANRTIIGNSLQKENAMPAAMPTCTSAASKLLFELAQLESDPEMGSSLSPESQESAALIAAETVKARLEELKQQLATSQTAEAEAVIEAQATKQAMEKLKSRLENLLKQVVAERSTANLAEQGRQQAAVEAQMMATELDAERRNISKLKAQTVEQIKGLQGQLAGMQKELQEANNRVRELEKMVEEEKEMARETLRGMESEATSQEQKLEQVVASLRLKIEQAAQLYRREMEEALQEHEAELQEKEERHLAELQEVEENYKATLGSLEISREVGEAALQLRSAISTNESLVDELAGAQECMSRMSDELAMLNDKVVEDRMKREAQVEEELQILRSAQAHVDRMAAEKLSLIQQKAMLQKAILASLALALAGPITVLTMMTSGNVPQVDALEMKASQQMIRMIDPTFHERRNEHFSRSAGLLESPSTSAKLSNGFP